MVGKEVEKAILRLLLGIDGKDGRGFEGDTIRLVDGWCEDDVHETPLIFEGKEGKSLGSGRALSTDKETCDLDTGVVREGEKVD